MLEGQQEESATIWNIMVIKITLQENVGLKKISLAFVQEITVKSISDLIDLTQNVEDSFPNDWTMCVQNLFVKQPQLGPRIEDGR